MKDIPLKKINLFLEAKLDLGATNNIWNYRLKFALIQISKDLKKHPSVRGGLLLFFIRGDLEMLEKAYKGVRISREHFIFMLPGASISAMDELKIKKTEATEEQCQMLFANRELNKFALR